MNRRAMLKTVAAASAGAVFVPRGLAAKSDWQTDVLKYLETLARPDGGYAWGDQEQSHLTPTFAVIGCHHVLKQTPPKKAALAEFVRTHHPSQLKKLEQERRVFEFQQVQALAWLDEDVSEFREKIGAWTAPLTYLKQYEQHGWPIFQSETGAIRCRPLLGLKVNDLSPAWIDYVTSRRRANGSFNNTPASDGSDGHVMNTWYGLQALRVLRRDEEKKTQTIAWLRACQLANGGFTFAPKPEFGGVDDVAYTWAAVRSLQQLGATPTNRERCISYLHSLANSDGGFGDRPGWLSNATATYYALDALDALGALNDPLPRKSPIAIRKSLPPDLKLYTIQIEAPGTGSPSEAVELARSLRIHLWGAKNAKAEWITRAQSLADERKVPVTFFVSNEEYGTWVNVPGLGTYSHTSDIIAPANVSIGAALGQRTSGVSPAVTWPEFRERRLDPLVKANGRLLWQFGENEELVRMFLDDSLQRGGYAAISTFHFGNPDFTNTEPFLKRYRGQIPFVALQDAHGGESWWWSERLAGFRTMFLATEPTWHGWLNALKNDWVAAIRHDALSGYKTWMHGGVTGVQEFLRARESEWKWWGDKPDELRRPPAIVTLLRAGDSFEKAAPANG
ncbi:MAG TPA: prenyltransferase/squalene oxidase repeat-containing protein, partial [Candidatus Acidoferrum sp.]|nr:prenyltransferase/squalene oxidase repeat-containing protein [Candidatus Acidoferrum sp.]